MSAPNQNTPNQNNNSPVVTIVLAIIALIGSLGVAWITAYYTAGRSFDQKLAESGTKIDELIKKIEPLDVKIKAAESKFTEIDGKLKVATDDLATFKSFLNESKRSVPVIWVVGQFEFRLIFPSFSPETRKRIRFHQT